MKVKPSRIFSKLYLPSTLPIVVLLGLLSQPVRVQAAPPFNITGTSNTPQTLASGTGIVTSTGLLQVTGTGGGNNAVTVTGNSAIINSGTISQPTNSGGRGIDLNTNNVTLTITNTTGALIQTQDADPIRANKANDSVVLNNYGTVNSINSSGGGAQAVDWNSVTTGSNTLNNYSTGILTSDEADAVRPGVNGVIKNDGLIKSRNSANDGQGSDGIDAQTNTGVAITNAATIVTGTALIEGARHGITGGNTTTGTYSMTITNNAHGTIQGDNGSGVNIDGINGSELVTITNSGMITGNGHQLLSNTTAYDGDGVDVDGVVNINNSGIIKSINAFGGSGSGATIEYSEGVTVGGGTIINSGTIEGDVANGNTTAVGRGITLAGVDKDAAHNDAPINPPQGIYVSSTITNTGLIRGQTDSGIAVTGSANAFSITINNLAGGTIEGGGATAAAIETGSNNVTINNAGIIQADSSGKAINFGSGTNSLTITGGSASIIGAINGGNGTTSLTIDPGAGNTFSYSGTISNMSSAQIKSGKVVLSGATTYGTQTVVVGGTLVDSGMMAGSVSVSSSATLSSGHNTTSSAGTVTVTSNEAGGGILAPGETGGAGLSTIGKLNINGSLTLGTPATSGRARLQVELGGIVAGTDYDQVSTTGAINLANVDLVATFVNNFKSTIRTGDTFFLLLNGGLSPITGAFANQSQSVDALGFHSIWFEGQEFKISYTANAATNTFSGGGEDVALVAVPEPGNAVASILLGLVALAKGRLRRRSE